MFFIIALILAIAIFSDLSLSTIYSLAAYINPDLIFILTICIILAASAKSALIGFTPWLAKAKEGFGDNGPQNKKISKTFKRNFSTNNKSSIYKDYPILPIKTSNTIVLPVMDKFKALRAPHKK
jgi:hypothetical protein